MRVLVSVSENLFQRLDRTAPCADFVTCPSLDSIRLLISADVFAGQAARQNKRSTAISSKPSNTVFHQQVESESIAW